MSFWIKQSTAAILKLGPFVDSTDGVTAETGLTIAQADIQISKNGAAFAQTSNAAPTTTHDADGWYPVPLTTTDTGTLGTLTVQVAMAGALPVWKDCMVVPANVWDSMFGADALQVDVAQWLGTAAHAATVAGVPVVQLHENGGGGGINAPLNFEDLSIVDTTGLVDITQAAADKAWSTAARVLTAATNLAGVEVDVTAIHGSALTETIAGYLAAGFVKQYDVASPVFTSASVNQTGDSYAIVNSGTYGNSALNTALGVIEGETSAIKTKTDYLPSATAGAAGGVFIAGTNAATTITTALTANITGNLSGSVGSVTGAVGSVTGAVGSVTGAVGSVTGNVGGNVVGSVGSLVGHTVQTGDSYAVVSHVTYGLSALNTDIDAILADTGTDGVVVAAVSKTGYALSSTGLDSVATTAPTGVASNFREMLVQTWRALFKKVTETSTQRKTYADDGTTVLTTQTLSDDSTTQTSGAAS